MIFDMKDLSKQYTVKQLTGTDVAAVYALCKENPLYYQYCPPFVTEDSIRADMKALPPRKTMEDKYYLGFYEGDVLLAVMDLILGFPNDETAFVGFFMMNKEYQDKGIGTELLAEFERNLKGMGIRETVLMTNLEDEDFYKKRGFHRSRGVIYMGKEM